MLTSGPSEAARPPRVARWRTRARSAGRRPARDRAMRRVRPRRAARARRRAPRSSSAATAGRCTSPRRRARRSSGLYGPTLPRALGAVARSRLLVAEAVEPAPLPCRPCDQRVCAPGDFRCLTADHAGRRGRGGRARARACRAPARRQPGADPRTASRVAHCVTEHDDRLDSAAGAPPRDRLELAGVAGLLGFVGALQLSIAAAGIVLAFTLGCWAGSFVLVHHESVGRAAVLLAAAGLRGADAGLGGVLARSAHELHRLQAARAVPDRADGLPVRRAATARLTVLQVIITVGAASAASASSSTGCSTTTTSASARRARSATT